jgi:hypothetical protein
VRRFFRVKGLSKNNHAGKLLWISVSLAVICGSLAVVTQLFAEELFGWNSTVHRERAALEPNRFISINSADMPLEVYTYDGDKVIIEYIGETELVIIEDELELKISRIEDFTLSLFSTDKFNYKMTVWLPNENHMLYDEIKLTSASGNLSARNIRADFIYATSRNGNINFHGAEGEIIIATRTGDVRLEFINFTDRIKVETDTGNIKVLMPERYGVKLSYVTESGRFTSDFFSERFNAQAGDVYLNEGANPIEFTVFTDTGELEFYKRVIYVD